MPPDYAAYKLLEVARLLYYEYANQVEPFGLDESWIDVTGSLRLFGGDPMLIAQRSPSALGRSSGSRSPVGVSWNKVFAKLGSDTDPGDGIIEITRDNYKEFAWPMPASKMIYAGPATMRKLHAAGYETIGDLAHAGDYFLKNRFGKIGFMLRSFARGEDMSPVRVMDPKRADVDYVIKGIGNGLTAPRDLVCEADVKALVSGPLSESVSACLRESLFRCGTIAVGVCAHDFTGYSRQRTLRVPTRPHERHSEHGHGADPREPSPPPAAMRSAPSM